MTEPTRPAGDRPGEADDALLGELRRIAADVEPVPESLVLSARELLTWRRVDAELAELLSDSALDDSRLAGVRGRGDTRSVSFESGGLTIELDVLPEGRSNRIVGQVVPPESATVEVQSAGGSQSLVADEHGRFHAEGVPAGRLRLRVTGHSLSARPIETSWITI